jgi:hypothetical protein
MFLGFIERCTPGLSRRFVCNKFLGRNLVV